MMRNVDWPLVVIFVAFLFSVTLGVVALNTDRDTAAIAHVLFAHLFWKMFNA